MNALPLSLALSAGLFLLLSRHVVTIRTNLIGRLSRQMKHSSVFAIEWATFRGWITRNFKSRNKLKRALEELPEILEMLSVALFAGDSLFAAMARVAPRAQGVLASEFQRIFSALEVGSDLNDELADLALRLPHRQVVEFTSKLSTALRRGSPLAQMLLDQAASARSDLRNDVLRQVGRNETRMLIPLVFLILPVTVLFAIYPSLQLLNFDYL
jgi:tight adherence protein C